MTARRVEVTRTPASRRRSISLCPSDCGAATAAAPYRFLESFKSPSGPSRARTDRLSPRRAAVGAQAVAGAADGLDRATAERPVDLLAQVAHVHVDHVRAVLVLVVPGHLEQLVAREDLAGPA